MTTLWIIAAIVLWLAFARLSAFVLAGPRRDPYDPIDGFLLLVVRVMAVVLHRARYEGLDNRDAAADAVDAGDRPVIVVANHTAGVDPLLVQNVIRRFEVRWMMAADMRVPVLEPFWKWSRIIDVDRTTGDPASAREGLRHLKSGGVLGIFPEGGLERPARHILPFMPGVGLLIRKSNALVLPVCIEGTPQIDPAFASLWHTGNVRVRFGRLIDYSQNDLKAGDIAKDLRSRFQQWTGWPLIDRQHSPESEGAAPASTDPRASSADEQAGSCARPGPAPAR